MAKAAKRTVINKGPDPEPDLELDPGLELGRPDEAGIKPRYPVINGQVLTRSEVRQYMSGLDPMAVK